ncbi:hypoxanthine phosphoribosyltransferase [candidate division WOR-3 bacterium]|nr:hypoxanthine phosphoribosyltransferase [candidate division WOR-3 bacterium]
MKSSKNKKLTKVINEDKISKRVKELGAMISRDYKDKVPVLICVLKGAKVFFSNLIKEIKVPCKPDFIYVSSYNKSTKSSGKIKLVKDLSINIKDKDVIIIEDIVDTGLTINYILNNLKLRKPKSLKVCTLLDKSESRQIPVPLDYVGFNVLSLFLVGYGLDYAERHRDLPYIASLNE